MASGSHVIAYRPATFLLLIPRRRRPSRTPLMNRLKAVRASGRFLPIPSAIVPDMGHFDWVMAGSAGFAEGGNAVTLGF